ncbi:MAG: serine hydrolase [Pseudomonadota bacterium]
MKKLGVGLATASLLLAVLWIVIGPDWRRLVLNAPTNSDVLFWSQNQRDAGFRMLDRVGFMVGSRTIRSSETVRELPIGDPLEFDFDIDAYFDSQRHAALVIIEDGKIRYERYGLGFGESGRWTSFSVAKSFTSTLVGAAIQDGYIESLHDPISKYVSGLQGSAYDDVTIEQLLTMTSGVRWIEDYEDPDSDIAKFNKHVSNDGESNVVSYLAALPRAHPPGEVWHYSTGETNLIGILVSEATGKALADYLSEKIWRPFGMQQDATWLLDGDGSEMSGCCVQAATRDFARYGLFMLEGGTINGERIVPEGWIEAATQNQVSSEVARREGYGYQWWIHEDGMYEAGGIFGQGIFIDPKRKLVIAANSSWGSALGYDEFDARAKFYRDVSHLIAAGK